MQVSVWQYIVHTVRLLHVSATHMAIFREVHYRGELYIEILQKCLNQWPQHVRCMPWVWQTFIHFCVYVSFHIASNCSVHCYGTFKIMQWVFKNTKWKRGLDSSGTRQSSMAASTVTASSPQYRLLSLTSVTSRCSIHRNQQWVLCVCVCIVRAVVSGSSWVYWQRETRRDEGRRTAVNCLQSALIILESRL